MEMESSSFLEKKELLDKLQNLYLEHFGQEVGTRNFQMLLDFCPVLLSQDEESGGASSLQSEEVKSWYDWCEKRSRHPSDVKVTSTSVPDSVLPKNYKADLYDIRVTAKRGPDDKLYHRSKELRQKVARGNTILKLIAPSKEINYDAIIFALRKFTGGMGDDDDDLDDHDDAVWKDYFLEPIENCKEIVCTEKPNGAAAHLSARWLDDRFVLCCGSKNVHMLISKTEHLNLYRDSRYNVAQMVANTTISLLKSQLTLDQGSMLLSFLHHTKYTFVMEILSKEDQHVVNLDYLPFTTKLNFISLTEFTMSKTPTSLTAIPPHVGIHLANALGIREIQYKIIPISEMEDCFNRIRRGDDIFGLEQRYEGAVLYFLNDKRSVVGMVKKKTAWYILCRAIREKAQHGASAVLVHKSKEQEIIKKTQKRIKEIKEWLGLEEGFVLFWQQLATDFIRWILKEHRPGGSRGRKEDIGAIRSQFPRLWVEFLEKEGKTDEYKSDEEEQAQCSGEQAQHSGKQAQCSASKHH